MCAADAPESRRTELTSSHWSVGSGRAHESDKILTTFRELGVLPEICDALERAGIVTPFAIQEMTLSVALIGTDLIGQARTGTGKTLAFGIPVLQRSVAPKDPTYAEMPAGQAAGAHRRPDPRARAPGLQRPRPGQQGPRPAGPHRLRRRRLRPAARRARSRASTSSSARPGRLIDLANRRALDLSHVHALVLDEADEMLDLGLPARRREAALDDPRDPADDAVLGDHAGRDRRAGPPPHAAPDEHPRRVVVRHAMVPATAQFIYLAHDLDKPEIIGRILQAEDADKIIVFTRTKRQAQRVADDLAERGFSASALHGDMAQVAREKALTKFREDKLRVLVATDVAARGIDVAGVSHVINYTCPEDDKTYVHRIGRTGRAGASGIAITFVDWADLHRWKMINKTLDLPFDEPQETYSTSEHLFHDQGIAPGTKGRIVDPAPVERKPREDRGRATATAAATAAARDGEAAARAATATGTATGPAPAAASRSRPAGEQPPAEGEPTSAGAAGSRNRRRRRSQPRPGPPLRRPRSDARPLDRPTRRRHRSGGDDDRRCRSAANSHSATRVLASSAGCSRATAACRAGRGSARAAASSIGMSWKPMAAPLSPSVNRTKYCIAAGVVDAAGLLGAGVDLVGAGVEVVVDAARDQVGPRRPSRRRSTSQTRCRSSLNTTRRPLAGVRPGSARSSEPASTRRSGVGSSAGLGGGRRRLPASVSAVAVVLRRSAELGAVADRRESRPPGRVAGDRAARRRPPTGARRSRRAARPAVTATDDPEHARSGRSGAGPRRAGAAAPAGVARAAPGGGSSSRRGRRRAARLSATSR